MGKKKKKPFEVDRYFSGGGREATAGKDSTAELSIDGKSFYYRDPRNPDSNEAVQANYRGDSGSAEDNMSKNAYAYTNPLYDYSYGQVRDAAKALDIGNVNSKGEVNQILKQIRSGGKSKAEDFKDDFIDKRIAPRESSNTEVEIPTATSGDATAGDNSIASSIAQINKVGIKGNSNRVDQDNSADQKQAGNFLDQYKLSLKSGEGLNLTR
jgi:hypothetical protein